MEKKGNESVHGGFNEIVPDLTNWGSKNLLTVVVVIRLDLLPVLNRVQSWPVHSVLKDSHYSRDIKLYKSEEDTESFGAMLFTFSDGSNRVLFSFAVCIIETVVCRRAEEVSTWRACHATSNQGPFLLKPRSKLPVHFTKD